MKIWNKIFFSFQILLKFLLLRACVDKSTDYCNEIVEKSVCNPLKNDCFCRPGFVAIREDDKLACKTLLTNLKCRVDSDCTDVQNSSCHPGAGKCSCPYNTIYVPDLHACRLRSKYNTSPFCVACKKTKGDCYIYDPKDKMTVFNNQSNKFTGCACLPGRKSSQNVDWEHLCSSYMVDIGEFCDEENYFCHSKLAICSRKKSFSLQNRFCSCNSNQIPVYQDVLDYHECFDIVKNSDICANCEKAEGVCYDADKNGIPDGCICPPHLSHVAENFSLKYDQQLCAVNHIKVDCSHLYISVCYIPHFHSPYGNLFQMLKQNHSILGINIQRSTPIFSNRCLLTLKKNKEFCIMIHDAEQLSECMIYKIHLKTKKVMYKANLQIIFDLASSNTNKDMQFPIKCISDDISLADSENGITTSSRPTLSFLKVNLDFVNENEDKIQSAAQNEPVRLQISLKIVSNEQGFVRVEECYLNNNSAFGSGYMNSGSIKIIQNGCPDAKVGFYARFHNLIRMKNKILSDQFIAFQRYQTDSVIIRCKIKVCLELNHCYPFTCFEDSEKASGKLQFPSTTNQWIFVERWTKLVLQKNISNRNNNHIQQKSCNHLICLSMSQTLFIALLLSSLVIALFCLLIIIGNSKAQSLRLKRNSIKKLQTNPLSFHKANYSCPSCSTIPQIRSFVTFNPINMKTSSPIKCYPLTDLQGYNLKQTFPNECLQRKSVNIESVDEIYEC